MRSTRDTWSSFEIDDRSRFSRYSPLLDSSGPHKLQRHTVDDLHHARAGVIVVGGGTPEQFRPASAQLLRMARFQNHADTGDHCRGLNVFARWEVIDPGSSRDEPGSIGSGSRCSAVAPREGATIAG